MFKIIHWVFTMWLELFQGKRYNSEQNTPMEYINKSRCDVRSVICQIVINAIEKVKGERGQECQGRGYKLNRVVREGLEKVTFKWD